MSALRTNRIVFLWKDNSCFKLFLLLLLLLFSMERTKKNCPTSSSHPLFGRIFVGFQQNFVSGTSHAITKQHILLRFPHKRSLLGCGWALSLFPLFLSEKQNWFFSQIQTTTLMMGSRTRERERERESQRISWFFFSVSGTPREGERERGTLGPIYCF